MAAPEDTDWSALDRTLSLALDANPDEVGQGLAGLKIIRPAGVLDHQSGPRIMRQFRRFGARWLAVYEAVPDERGWLVTRASARPLDMLAGDYIHARLRVLENEGTMLMCQAADDSRHLRIPVTAVVFLEEMGNGVRRGELIVPR
jgi:hypothetical protein